MIQGLLEQRGISARVDGAQLQGGVGELPVTGFVRVVVDDDDYAAARAIIDEWESANVPDPIPVPADRTTKGFVAGLIGLALGIAVTYAFLRVPVSLDQIDNNAIDRNYDGKVDLIQRFDGDRRIDRVEADEDFNGSFETRWYYRANQPFLGEVDTDGDSSIDFRTHFRDGVPVSSEFLDPGSGRPVRVDYYRLGKIVSAEIDTDRDGRLDTRHKYSDVAAIVGTERIEVSQ